MAIFLRQCEQDFNKRANRITLPSIIVISKYCNKSQTNIQSNF